MNRPATPATMTRIVIDLRRRPAWEVATVALSAGLALFHLVPLMPSGMVTHYDVGTFTSGVVEARNALAEGQFPIRVAPGQLTAARYPVFQFYGNLPFTAAGWLHLALEKNPYAAWKLWAFATLAAGGWATYRLALRWGRRPGPALAAAAVFLCAPYTFCNLWDRAAMSELSALCLLPLAGWATWACLARRGLGRIVGCAAAWTAVALTHNITYLYAATFVGLLVASVLRPRRRMLRRVGRLVAAAALHVALAAWYVAPQVAVMSQIGIGRPTDTPYWSRALVPPEVLFAPSPETAGPANIPRLAVQVGWVVMAGVLAALASLFVGRRRSAGPPAAGLGPARFRRGMIVRLLGLWAVALVLCWQPFDVWAYVPEPYYFVQFSYRLLGFTTAWGALLAALGLAGLMAWRPAVASRATAAGAVALAFTCWLYFPELTYYERQGWKEAVKRPVAGGLEAYLMAPRPADPPLPPGTARMPPEQAAKFRLDAPGAKFQVALDGPTRVVLPVLWYPNMLRVTEGGDRLPYGVDGRHVTVDLPRGQHILRVHFEGLRRANALGQAGVVAAAAMLAATAAKTWRRRRSRPPVPSPGTPGEG